MSKPSIGPFVHAVVMSPDPDAAVQPFLDFLDYRKVGSDPIPADLAQAWGAPAMAGRKSVSIQSVSGKGAVLRYVQGTPPADYAPFRFFGWNALEILVTDVNALPAKLEKSPFQILGLPRDLYPSGAIRAMQVRTPNNEFVYLTQVNDYPETEYLPRARTFVDDLFIVILGSDDFDKSWRFYEEHFNTKLSEPKEMRLTGVNVAFGLPIETKHKLSVFRLAGKSAIELDGFPKEAKHRPITPGEIPPGIAMIGFEVDSLDAVKLPWRGPVARREGPIYNNRRSAVFTGPSGEWVELVEKA